MSDTHQKAWDWIPEWVLVLGMMCGIAAMWCIYMLGPKPVPKPVIVRPPINFTDTGKAVGKRVGRFGIGFVKGLFTSNDEK